MAVDGSRWQFLGRARSRLASRNAIDNEFFTRLPSAVQLRLNRGCGPHFPQSHIKRHFDNSATGPQGLSTIANILLDQHRESGRLRFARGFKMAAARDLTIVDQAFGADFPRRRLYTIYRLLQISLMHLLASRKKNRS